MDTHIISSLLELSLEELPGNAVRDLLGQSLNACRARSWQRMSELAKNARVAARKQDEHKAEAIALIHLGLALWQLNRPDEARRSCDQAKRVYQRNPLLLHGLGEGLACFAMGLICDRYVETMDYYREALDFFNKVADSYAGEGNRSKRNEIRSICEMLHLEISGHTLIVRLDGEPNVLLPPWHRNQTLIELQPDVEYRIIPIFGNEYREFGLAPNDAILVREIEQVDETVLGGLGIWYEDDCQLPLEKFTRDDQGNVQFVKPGHKLRIIGESDAHPTGYVEAYLKPI